MKKTRKHHDNPRLTSVAGFWKFILFLAVILVLSVLHVLGYELSSYLVGP